jgi:hypothetical protein
MTQDDRVTYLLERDDVLLAHMPMLDFEDAADDEPVLIHCAFEPTPEFGPYQAMFEEDALLASQMNEHATPELLDRAQQLTDDILNLGLQIRTADESQLYRRFLLGIDGDQANFQPLDGE